MSDSMARCKVCDVEVQQYTAERTGGLCMPCAGGTRKPDKPAIVVCNVGFSLPAKTQFRLLAKDLLTALEATSPIAGPTHPNHFELEAQRALLRYAITRQSDLELNDDHWGRTGETIVKLFEQGNATIVYDGLNYSIEDVVKEDWGVHTGPLGDAGGFLYRTHSGEILYRIRTWIS